MPAEVPFSTSTLASFLFVLARLGGMLSFVPIPGVRTALDPVRAVLLLSLTFAVYPVWPAVEPGSLTAGRFLIWIAGECMIGTAIGLLVGFLSECVVFGAQAVVMQAGFSYASAIDPSSQADSTV
ncbi:MAG: flagellar biosynthetic protein FliR, partial [Acidobacteria bacterium]|nr:flagellar biosynthetic protein FliR [Acidobacteriota bacterium]